MTLFTLILVFIGVGFTAVQLTRFLVWLDGADEPDEASIQSERRHTYDGEPRKAA